MFFLKKYWVEIMIVVGVLMVLGYIKHLGNEIDNGLQKNAKLQSEVSEVRGYLKAQNMIIENNRVDYETRINRLPTVLHEIETRYKTEKIPVIQWRDKNETHDCNSSMQYLNTYQF